MLTAHVINVCAKMGNNGFWAGRLVKGAFAAYGGLMMKDLLAGDFSFPCLMENGEANFTLLYVSLVFYFVFGFFFFAREHQFSMSLLVSSCQKVQ